MKSSRRTITTVGLSLRDETMIRSLVDVGNADAVSAWRFVDDIDADVALCAPESPMSRVAVARGRLNGRPCCICYGERREDGPHFDTALRAPLRVGDFWALLEGLAKMQEHKSDASGVVRGTVRPDLAGRPVAQVLSALFAEKRSVPERWTVQIGDIAFDLLVPQRMLEIVAPREATFDALVDVASATVVDRVETAPAKSDDKPRAGSKPLDVLLWKIGLRQVGVPASAWARDAIPVRLRRWPDFGHLGAHRQHLTMTSLLTREAMTPGQLVAMADCDQEQVFAFLNACALLGLIQFEPGAARSPAAPVRPASGLTKLMRSFRVALGMGD